MGVGVYESDFDKTGGSFLVDGPLAREEDYKSYCSEHDDPMEYSEWSQDEYDSFNEALLESVETAGRELGFAIAKRRRFDASTADFDTSFTSIAFNDMVEIGWRSWEHDFVIGIGGNGGWRERMGDPEGYAYDILSDHGKAPLLLKEEYDVLSGAVEEYVRLRLLQDHFECRYRTSGYTTSDYKLPDDVQLRLETLRETVKNTTAKLHTPLAEAVGSLDRRGRIALMAALKDEPQALNVGVPVFDFEDNSILIYDPSEAHFSVVMQAPADLLPHLQAQASRCGLAPIVQSPETEDWLSQQQVERAQRGMFLIDAFEYAEAVGEDLTVEFNDGEKNQSVEFVKPSDEPSLGF